MDHVARDGLLRPPLTAVPRQHRHQETVVGGESRRGVLPGTRALMLAVLEDGIRAFLSRSRLLANEAECWVFSASRRSPFSFLVLCDTFGLDPDALRKRLIASRKDGVSGRGLLPRVRHNARSATHVRVNRKRRRQR